MPEFHLSKRAKLIEAATPEAMTAKRTAASLFKIIQFLFHRVPPDKKLQFFHRLRGKIMRVSPGDIGMKKTSPSSAIGQSISLSKSLLSGLNVNFVRAVLVELTYLLANVGLQNIRGK